MQRLIENNLREWKQAQRRKPLIVRGARQVGKSTLLRQFAANNELVLAEINLERHLYLDAVFKTLDLERIIYELEAVAGQKINSADTILFLDEIQSTPHAIQALGYFYEERPNVECRGMETLSEAQALEPLRARFQPGGFIGLQAGGEASLRPYLKWKEFHNYSIINRQYSIIYFLSQPF